MFVRIFISQVNNFQDSIEAKSETKLFIILRSLKINKWKIEIWRDIKCVSRGFIDVVLKEIELFCINNQTANEKSFSGNTDGHCSI